MKLEGKTILIISPQKWSNMFVSKHHYAIELAKRNNVVYFLEPFSKNENIIEIKPLAEYPNIKTIRSNSFWGSFLRFHNRPIYKFLLKNKLKKILAKINVPINLVINFDNTGAYTDLSIFKAEYKIFFPVDQINLKYLNEYKNYGKTIFSISPVILNSFKNHKTKKILLNHGLGNSWIKVAKESPKIPTKKDNKINVGYIGNIAMGKSIDMKSLTKVIKENNHVNFHFWGNYENNVNQLENELNAWINFLKNAKNVKLYGATKPEQLINEIDTMDAFLLCYDYNFEISKCSNSHKILEYLSTGKIIISSKISIYSDKKDLLCMLPTYDNKEYPAFFKHITENIENYNTIVQQGKRKKFALENTYAKQLEKIEKLTLD